MPPEQATSTKTSYLAFAFLEGGKDVLTDGETDWPIVEDFWRPLGVIEASDQQAALEQALHLATEYQSGENMGTPQLGGQIVVARVAVASARHWRERSASVELKHVTRWHDE